jgi:hypothetical protein
MVYQPLGWLGWWGGGGIARFHAVVGDCWEILVQVGRVGTPPPPVPPPTPFPLPFPPSPPPHPDRLPTGCHTIACNKTVCGCETFLSSAAEEQGDRI